MARSKRISISLKQRWRRFRYTLLPLLSFALCATLSVTLWQRQGRLANAVGEVEAVRLSVSAGVDGLLLPLPQGQWTLFDTLEKGQVITQLDDRPIRAAIRTLRLEVVRLHEELAAVETQVAWDQADRKHDDTREAVRLAWDVERRRLELLDRKAQVEIDRVELQRLEWRLHFLKPLRDNNVVSEMELGEEERARDLVARRIEENRKVVTRADAQLAESEKRAKSFSPQQIQIARLLAPVQAEIAKGESAVAELVLQVENLQIRAPISGVISEIFSWPGQYVRAGDPVLLIAAPAGRYIVSYVREDQRFRPTVDTPVQVRLRAPNSQRIATHVERIGPQFVLIPEHHRRDPGVAEWGLPVRIALPCKWTARPGELIDVTYEIWADKKSS